MRLVETELHWSVPLRGRNVTCVPFFWKWKASKSIKKEDQSITTLILTQQSCLGNVLAILPIANVSSRHRWYVFPLFECIGTPNVHWSCRAESRQKQRACLLQYIGFWSSWLRYFIKYTRQRVPEKGAQTYNWRV